MLHSGAVALLGGPHAWYANNEVSSIAGTSAGKDIFGGTSIENVVFTSTA